MPTGNLNPCAEIDVPRYPVVKTFEEAAELLRAGKGVGIDLTGTTSEQQVETMDKLVKFYSTLGTNHTRRSAVVCIETLRAGWPVSREDFNLHGSGQCLRGDSPCGSVLMNTTLPELSTRKEQRLARQDAGIKAAYGGGPKSNAGAITLGMLQAAFAETLQPNDSPQLDPRRRPAQEALSGRCCS